MKRKFDIGFLNLVVTSPKAVGVVLLNAVLAITLAACSGGVSEDGVSAQQANDAQKLADLYANVEGRWEGTVTNATSGAAPFRAELMIYMDYVNDGANPDGTAKLRPELRGRFMPVEFASTTTDRLLLSGNYNRNGRLVMAAHGTTAASGGGPSVGGSAPALTLQGVASGTKMTVQVTRLLGVWGTFEATRVTKNASAPSAGDADQMRDRFVRIHQRIEGRYSGTVRADNGNNFRGDVNIGIGEKIDPATGEFYPALMGHYWRFGSGGYVDWAMDIDYDAQTEKIFFRSGMPTGGSTGTGTVVSLSGTLKRGPTGQMVLELSVRDSRGSIGKLTANRIGSAGGAPKP